jgi:hypothetical protein
MTYSFIRFLLIDHRAWPIDRQRRSIKTTEAAPKLVDVVG